MPDDNPPAPAPAPQPAPRGGGDDDLLDDETKPSTSQFRRLRDAHRTAQTRIQELERENVDLKATAGTVETLRGQLLEQSLIARAAGVFAKPEDAVVFLREKVQLGKDGKIDDAKLGQEIDKLLEDRPYLKAQSSTPSVSPPRPLPNGGGTRPVPVGGGQDDTNMRANEALRKGFLGR